MDIRGKKVLVFGSGISGEGSCRLLLEKGADVVLYDGNEKLCADEIEAKILETKKEITRKEVESVLNCSKFTAINLINELLKENLIEKSGSGPSVTYKLK